MKEATGVNISIWRRYSSGCRKVPVGHGNGLLMAIITTCVIKWSTNTLGLPIFFCGFQVNCNTIWIPDHWKFLYLRHTTDSLFHWRSVRDIGEMRYSEKCRFSAVMLSQYDIPRSFDHLFCMCCLSFYVIIAWWDPRIILITVITLQRRPSSSRMHKQLSHYKWVISISWNIFFL